MYDGNRLQNKLTDKIFFNTEAQFIDTVRRTPDSMAIYV